MAEPTGHTVKAFDADIDNMRSLISQMGGLCELQIQASIEVLTRRDAAKAMDVIAIDDRIDALEIECEKLAIQTIALRAPMAQDLREIIAVLKISSVLERVGDYAKNIAKRATVLSKNAHAQPVVIIPEMGTLVAKMLSDALDAFVARDVELAKNVVARDAVVDDYYAALFRSLLTYMMEDPSHITPSMHLLFVAKNLERIGDKATSIAEMVFFAATGEQILHRPKGDDVALAALSDRSS
ncbi:MAG: phosphate signaling complex protein PhoU [Polymorphobacter sp.]